MNSVYIHAPSWRCGLEHMRPDPMHINCGIEGREASELELVGLKAKRHQEESEF